jgi:hypothetical protein
MILKIHCKYNNLGAWCKCGQVKRKWYHIGGKPCIEYGDNQVNCIYKEPYYKTK